MSNINRSGLIPLLDSYRFAGRFPQLPHAETPNSMNAELREANAVYGIGFSMANIKRRDGREGRGGFAPCELHG